MNRDTINRDKLKEFIHGALIFFINPFIWMWFIQLPTDQDFFIGRYLGALIIECGVIIIILIIGLLVYAPLMDYLYSD